MSGGIDAGALYPPKKFFGAARNVEEGGSLTILATALVETEQPHGRGDLRGVQGHRQHGAAPRPHASPSAASTRPSTSTPRRTRHEELLFDRKQLQQVWKLRRVLSGLAADGNAAPGLELLIDRLKTFRTNDEFLAEIAKATRHVAPWHRSRPDRRWPATGTLDVRSSHRSIAMKTDIHPDVRRDAPCAARAATPSPPARPSGGELHVELCNECHPFFTGKQKLVDTGGRVERFNKRYQRTGIR